jgi:hypothetical protein
MGKKLKQLATRVTALEKIIAGMLSGEKATRGTAAKKKAKKAAPKKVIRAKVRSAKRRLTNSKPKPALASNPTHIVRAEDPIARAPVEPATRLQPQKSAPAPLKPAQTPAIAGQRPFPVHHTGR